MPKKHQQRALQIKPQSTSSHTLALSKSTGPQHGTTSKASVNDLIRESRRLQLRSESRTPTAPDNAHSVHPTLRAVLDLPQPPPPAPRHVPASRVVASTVSGPSRPRRIPGPPPPRSWLIHSIHAPPSVRSTETNGYPRIQVRSSNLPDGLFPPSGSLQDLVLKRLALDWEWHAENDLEYFTYLPVRLRELLLSYIAVYGDNVKSNPLKMLLLHETDTEEKDEVIRLDLSNGLGHWTTLKQLERDLLVQNSGSVDSSALPDSSPRPVLESWDVESDREDIPTIAVHAQLPRTIHNFSSLKHLSLAISPANNKVASWSALISLAAQLRTLTSLSLAHWPQPTFTPIAASTRAVIHSPGSRPVVYGGSDMYTAHDNNWREAAGILRTLSRSLYCLRWLDLTGCGDWFAALQWVPSPSSSSSSSPSDGSPLANSRDLLGPEWNGAWRGLESLILEVGWRPVAPSPEEDLGLEPHAHYKNMEFEGRMYRYKKDRERFTDIRSTASAVARHLRALRKFAGGRWIDVEVGEDLEAM